MIFRSGKYKGQSLDVVKKRDPRYVAWVRENRPEMLRSTRVAVKPSVTDQPRYVEPPDIPRAGWVPPGSIEDAFG